MQRDAATLLYGNAVPVILVSLLTSSFLVFAFSNPLTDTFKQMWRCGMSFLLALRMADVFWWKAKLQPIEFNGNNAVRRYTAGANLTAIMWAGYAVFIAINDTGFELTTTVVTVAALAGGSTTVLAAHKYTIMFFAFILLLGPKNR